MKGFATGLVQARRSCKAPIVWFVTERGKLMPVDAATVLPSDTKLELPRHRSHFATCPNADRHRKPHNESSSPAGVHRSVQRGGSAATDIDGATTSGPDATSLQGTSDLEGKMT